MRLFPRLAQWIASPRLERMGAFPLVLSRGLLRAGGQLVWRLLAEQLCRWKLDLWLAMSLHVTV